MFDYQATVDALTQWGGFLRNHVPVERWPSPALWSGVAVVAGAVLAFWGARILRTVYVLGFMVVGGFVGSQLAGSRQVDLLIGLTLGAGVCAVLAFLLFRWWVAFTTGSVAVLILLVAGAPRLNQEFIGFNDFRQGVGTSDWSLALQSPEPQRLDSMTQARAYVREFWDYLLAQRRAPLVRTAIALALVWVLATAVGLLLPRLTVVFGTSIVGVLLLAGGAAVMLSTRWPGVWAGVLEHQSWFLAGLGLVFVAALSFQARYRRPTVLPSAPTPVAARPV